MERDLEDLPRGPGRRGRHGSGIRVLLLGLKFADSTATGGAGRGPRVGGYALSLVCGVVCIGIIAIGIYAMTQKT